MFKERKAAQMAAFFLDRAGGSMPHMKLIKLMYLADRRHYGEHGCPISNDVVVAMRNGPVLSRTLDLINGYVPSSENWDELISARENHRVALRRDVTERDSGDLSKSEEEAMGAVFAKFGDIDQWKLVEHTHAFPEWTDPGDSVLPISPRDILSAVGKGADEIEACLGFMEEDRELAAAFASIRGEAP